jgi:uncharacterized membrane protein
MSALITRAHAAAWPPRSALKTLTYALTHLVVAMAVAYALTGSWAAALAIGLIEPAVQTVAYLVHERAWTRADAQREASSGCTHQGPSSP